MLELDTAELDDPRYAANPSNRCYYCKTELWSRLVPVARARGFATVVDGTNADDLSDYRPGAQAAREHHVASPLAELGFTKLHIRHASRALGIPTWQQPSSPCLSSRLPYGTEVTRGRLRQIELAEAALRRLGIAGDLRVRFHDDLARVELAPTELSAWLDARAHGGADRGGVGSRVRASRPRSPRIPFGVAERAPWSELRVTPDELRGDRSSRNAVALAAAIATLGIECALEVRGGLALLLPTPEGVAALQVDESRRAVLALAKEHGFTHVAIELPSERRKSSTPPTDAPLLRD